MNKCSDKSNCNTCPDFVIKRHDTKPDFKVSISDCDGPLDFLGENYILESNMWTKGKLRRALTETEDYFQLADNVGFNQIMINDIIMVEQTRLPEYMLVVGFDEKNHFIKVQRGYHGSLATSYKKGQPFRIFRFLNNSCTIQTILDDFEKEDSTVLEDQLVDTLFVQEWEKEHTCLPGCYWLEFKLLKMQDEEVVMNYLSSFSASVTPSFTPSNYTPSTYQCSLGEGVEWIRRFPLEGEGFVIQIVDSFTPEI